MWKEIPPFSFSAGERKIMAHFVVICLFLLWLRLRRAVFMALLPRREQAVSCLREADAVGDSNLSTAAEADGHLTRFDDDRYLAPSLGVFEHAFEAAVLFQNVDILEGYLAAGEVLTGPRSIGSKVLAKYQNGVRRHRFLSLSPLSRHPAWAE